MVGRRKSVTSSCNRNRKKKATQFQKGGKRQAYSRKADKRMGDLPGINGKTGHESQAPTRIVRITELEAVDAVAMCSESGTRLPYKLRPRPEKEIETILLPDSNERDENIIVNLRKVSELITHVHSAMCRHPNINIQMDKRNGLCVYLVVVCAYCGYRSPSLPMTDTIKHERGHKMGVLNNMAVLPVLKSKVGLDDVCNVLTCLNIKAPSKTTLQRKLNIIANRAVNINEQQMTASQQHIAQVHSILGREPTADVQFDVAYTCRPQGGCEKAAQSFGALIDHSTTRKLPIAIATANKHCRKKGCKHEDCTKNFRNEASIASSERTLLHDTLDKVERAACLRVRSITTDSGSQSAKAIRDYYGDRQRPAAVHYRCLVHKLRNMEKQLKQLNLKSIPKMNDKQAYLRKLASATRSRVRQELIRLKNQCRSDGIFVATASAAMDNIINCFTGDHGQCRKASRVCSYHLQPAYSHLPYNEPLKLSKGDLEALKTKLKKYFDTAGLHEVCRLYSTNSCESTNAAVFSYAPKTSCWTRNFTALCHSATHSKTIGPGKGTMQLAAASGVAMDRNSVMYRQLIARDRSRHYHKLRKLSCRYKQSRHFLRKRRGNRSLFIHSLYSTENVASSSAVDHSYGLTM